VGIRKGAILVSDGAGNQTQVLVSGVGNGAALNIDPGTQTQIGKGYSAAAGVAVDAAGNVFLADTGANAVYEYAGGAGTAVPIGTGLVSPTGVAVDGAGDVFIGDRGGSGSAKGRVVEVPIVSGALTNSRQSVVASGLGTPQGIFVDGTGTLYIADSANKNVLAVAPGQFGEAAAGLSFGTGLTTPSDVSVDNAGNLYIADAGTNQVLQISPEGVQSWFGTGLNAPSGVAAEPGGSIIVADQGNGRIVRIPSQAGTLNGAAQQILESSFASPHSVRLDGAGDLVVADNLANAVESLNRTAISAAFGTVKTGTTSTDQAITLSSTGNADLGLGSPLFTPLTGDFSLIQGATPCADGSTLKMGAVCDLEASFTPSTGTAESLTVDFSTLALNAAAYSVTLTGTGSSTSTPTLTVSTSLPSIAASQVLQLTVGVSGGTGNPAVTGAITVTSGSYASAPATITAGSAKITIPAGSLAVGSDTLTVSYTPDSAAASTYNGASTTVLLAVSPAGATAPVMTVSLSSTTLTTLQQLTATVGLSDGQGNPIPTGSVSLTSGSFTSTAVPLSSGSASISVQGALLALGSDLLTITYTPDSASSSIYTSVSQSDSVTVNPVPSFTLSNGGLIIVAPGATTGNTSAITVTPTYGFTGAVNLTCTVTTTAANPTDAATCALGTGASSATASVTISGATAATTTLSVKTTAASAKSTNPLKDFFLGGGGISLAGLLVFGFSFRRRNRGMLLGILLLAVVSGLVVGCSSSNGKQIPGTTVGNYTVTVTGTDAATGQLTSSTAVNVTVD
jgi:sugar lactone lactonase YvrE